MAQGKARDENAERLRKKRLSDSMKARYAEIRARQQEAAPPEPEPGIAQRSHTLYEIRKIERETGLVHVAWTDVGGKFMDTSYDKRTWRVVDEPADAGPMMQVPVFVSLATARELE